MPGKYLVQIDPIWDESANYHKDYRKVLIDVYCCPIIQLAPTDNTLGVATLNKCLKDFAIKLPET